MIGHNVTVTSTRYTFLPGASFQATCSTCRWRGDRFHQRGQADVEAHQHCETATPGAVEPTAQATTDVAGEAAERRYLIARAGAGAAARDAASTRAWGRIEAALGHPEHQAALDAEIDRRRPPGAVPR